MKKIVCLFLLLILLLPSGAWAEETASFAIDAQHIYPGMEMCYAQGYVPTVGNNIAHIVMPLVLKGTASCDTITAGIDLGDDTEFPFVFKNYANTFTWQRYEFDDGRVSCYLIRFDLQLSENRVNGSYPISVNVEGVTNSEGTVTQQLPLYVVIRDGAEAVGPEASLSQPRLMVGSYDYSPQPLQAGENGTVTITVTNMSTSQSARNIKLSFQDADGEILPAGTSSAYIPAIGTGESVSCSLTVRVAEKALVGPHTMTVTMEYEDELAAALSAADTIVLDIKQPLRLEYEQPSLPGKVTEGDNLSFSMNLMNLGKSTVYNALVTFEIPGLNNGGSVLVGNIEPGESEPAKTNLLVSAMDGRYGETAGKVVLSYENEAGEVFTREMDVHTVIEEKIDVVPAAEEDDHAKNVTVPWWGILMAAIVLLGIVGIITAKMMKKKKERQADELRL